MLTRMVKTRTIGTRYKKNEGYYEAAFLVSTKPSRIRKPTEPNQLVLLLLFNFSYNLFVLI